MNQELTNFLIVASVVVGFATAMAAVETGTGPFGRYGRIGAVVLLVLALLGFALDRAGFVGVILIGNIAFWWTYGGKLLANRIRRRWRGRG